MARRIARPYYTEPVSTLAAWARHLALFAVLAAIVSIIIVRFGFLEIQPALMTFAGALGLAVLAIAVSFAAFVAIWINGTRGFGHIALALILSLIVLAYPAYLFAAKYRKLPPIHDITTDAIDPPRFETLARLRTGTGANPAVYAGLYSAEQQREAYPDIEPVTVEIPPQKAYDLVIELITKRKWRIVDARAPQPPRQQGHIEAVARTPIMGFRDDVVVRIVPDGEGARIDLRSASRYFRHDLGANAARVTALMEDINDRADVVKQVKKSVSKSADPKKPAPKR